MFIQFVDNFPIPGDLFAVHIHYMTADKGKPKL